MIRKGECTNCGYCCRVIGRVQLNWPEQVDDPEFLEVRGIEPDGTKWIDVIDPCPQLITIVPKDYTEPITTQCRIWEKRPQTCINFPTRPEDIKDTPCTYWFEDEEGNKL